MKLMRKFCAALALIMALCACMGAACADAATDETAVTVGELKAEALDVLNQQWGGDTYKAVMETKDGIMLVTATIPQEQQEALAAINFMDYDDWDKYAADMDVQYAGAVVTSIEDITNGMMTAEELAVYDGKTIQELLDLGFVELGYGHNGERAEFELGNGYYAYNFKADIDFETYETMVENEEYLTLTVYGGEYTSISPFAIDIPMDTTWDDFGEAVEGSEEMKGLLELISGAMTTDPETGETTVDVEALANGLMQFVPTDENGKPVVDVETLIDNIKNAQNSEGGLDLGALLGGVLGTEAGEGGLNIGGLLGGLTGSEEGEGSLDIGGLLGGIFGEETTDDASGN